VRGFDGRCRELKSLHERVTSAEKNCKVLKEAVDVGRMELQSASANAKSIHAYVASSPPRHNARLNLVFHGMVYSYIDLYDDVSAMQGRETARN
jgi:hypothetical protein